MKINEIIQEGKLGNGAKHSTPDMQTYPALNKNNSPYAAYRFGLALAGSPDFDEPMDKHGPIGGDFTTIGYSDADKEILAAASAKMGISSDSETTDGSHELDGTHAVSPTRKVGAITLNKKKK